MKFKLPTWLFPKASAEPTDDSASATPEPELTEVETAEARVRDAEERVAAAARDCAAAHARCEVAVRRLESERSEDALKEIEDAKVAQSRLGEMQNVVLKDLESARGELRKAQYTEYNREFEQIRLELHDNSQVDDLAASIAVQIDKVIDGLMACRSHATARNKLRAKQQELLAKMGLPLHRNSYEDITPNWFKVKQCLLGMAEGLPGNDQRCRYLYRFADFDPHPEHIPGRM